MKQKSVDGVLSNKLIALAGNPNVGKSTVFNALTGLKQHTGNWPGKTVTNARGKCVTKNGAFTLVDLPGTYSLEAHSEEEKIASDFICKENPDVIVVVCDATCLERNLILVLQIMEKASHVVVCVNLMDEAKRKNISLDLSKLSSRLGVPVLGIVAREKESLAKLEDILASVVSGNSICNPNRMESDLEMAEATEIEKAELFARRAEYISGFVIKRRENTISLDRKLDDIFTGKVSAYPIMLFLFVGILWITMIGANYPSEGLSLLFMKLEGFLKLVFRQIALPRLVYDVLINGMFRVLFWVVAVMLPPMAIFFPLFTLLEDMGYLPRVAYNLDKPFQKCRTCGKQALTMCMGFGCNAVGVTGCRIIDSPRERLLAILTNNFIPCNGRFPTMIAVISIFFVSSANGVWNTMLSAWILALFILGSIALMFGMTYFLSRTILKGVPSSFTLEMPPYRKPQIGKVILRSILDRTLFVLGRAVLIAAPAGVIIWMMANINIAGNSLFQYASSFLDPLGKFMGLDGVILLAFLLGAPANEIVLPIVLMGYMSNGSIKQLENFDVVGKILVQNGWTRVTAVCMIVFMLLHWPCTTTLLTIKKETGSMKWAILTAVLQTGVGIACCILIASVSRFL